ISRDAAEAIAWCAAHDTGVIVYSPMQSGLLTGAFTEARATARPRDDWRSRSPDFTGEGLRRNLALADALRPIAARHDTTVAAVAVAWTPTWTGITALTCLARSPEQLDGWLPAAALTLPDADVAEIRDAIG